MPSMLLINPPLCEPTVPLLGPYQLAGFARKNNIDFKVLDCNIKLLEYMVNTSCDPIDNIKADDFKKFEIETCQKFIKSCNVTTYSELQKEIRKCDNVNQYWKILDYIRACYDMFSLRFDDIRFRLDGFDTRYRWNIWSEIEKFLQTESAKKLLKVIDDWITKFNICENQNRIIGLNITFESQLFFSILFCIAINNRNRDSFIVVGGGFVNSFINSADSIGPLDKYCDLVISGEGEAFLWSIRDKATVSIKDFMDKSEFSGKRAYYITAHDLCIEKLKVTPPFFDEEHLSIYPSPNKVIPLRFTYQCYWGKCKFCSDKEPHSCFSEQYNFEEVIHYCIDGYKNGLFDCIYFLDSAIPPKLLECFCDTLIRNKIKISWGTNVRADKPLINECFVKKLSDAGCVFIKFGLESGSQRVLDLMNKGTKVESDAKFIHLCRKYNIFVHSYVMFAFPGEEEEDRKKTCEFLLSDYSHPDNYNCSEFILYGQAPIAKELNYKFDEKYEEEGWHSASYSFTNDSIKQEIAELRHSFELKHKPASVLISTGHTIAYSKLMKQKKTKRIRFTNGTLLRLSNTVCESHNCALGKIIGRWRRRDGISYIQGNDVQILLNKIVNKTVYEVVKNGITTKTIFELINLGYIDCECPIESDSLEIKGLQQMCYSFGINLTKIQWYGFYDAT